MAIELEVIDMSTVQLVKDPTGATFIGYATVSGQLQTVRISFEDMKSIFGLTDQTGNDVNKVINQKALTQFLANKADTTNAQGTVVRTSDGKIPEVDTSGLAPKEKDGKKVVYSANGEIPESGDFISLSKEGEIYNSKQLARSAVSATDRNTGKTIAYNLKSGDSQEVVSTAFTLIASASAVDYRDGVITDGSPNNLVYQIDVTGYATINLHILITSYNSGGAFFDASGKYISGFRFTSGQGSTGDRKKIEIPSNATILKTTYPTNPTVPFDNVVLATVSNIIVTEQFVGEDTSQWNNSERWNSIVGSNDIFTKKESDSRYLSSSSTGVGRQQLTVIGGTPLFIPLSLKAGVEYTLKYEGNFTAELTRSTTLNNTGTIEYQDNFGTLGSMNFVSGYSETITPTKSANYLRLNFFNLTPTPSSVTVSISPYPITIKTADLLTLEQANEFYQPKQYTGYLYVGDVYVSGVIGVDTNNGLTADKPVNSIEKACEIASKSSNSDITIHLEQYEYRIANTIVVPSGKNYRFKKYGKVSIKGSKEYTNWESAGSGIIQTNIGADLRPIQAFVNSEPRYVANTGVIELDKPYTGMTVGQVRQATGITLGNSTKLTMSASDISNLSLNDNYKNGWIFHMRAWKTRFAKIISVDANNEITTKILQYYKDPNLQLEDGDNYATTGSRIAFFNFNFNFTTNGFTGETFKKGSYFVTSEGMLQYKLKDGENSTGFKMEIPIVDMLFDVKGFLELDGIEVSQTNYDYFDGSYGDFLNIYSADNQGAQSIDGAITVYGTANIKNCSFKHTAQSALVFELGSRDSLVQNCCFHEVGAAAVKIGNADTINPNIDSTPDNIVVDNCIVKHAGMIFPMACGISITHATKCKIQHCDISEQLYTGINVGFGASGWGDADRTKTFRGCYVGYNNVHHCFRPNMLYDGAGIYVISDSHGLVIENNYVHDLVRNDGKIHALYMDENSRSVLLKNNIVHNCGASAFVHASGPNVYDNNIFYDVDAIHRTYNQKVKTLLTRNIFQKYVTLYTNESGTSGCRLDGNIYYGAAGTVAIPLDDTNGKSVNPMFTDPDNGDFRFSDTENIDKIHFDPIDTDSIGVYGEMKRFLIRQ